MSEPGRLSRHQHMNKPNPKCAPCGGSDAAEPCPDSILTPELAQLLDNPAMTPEGRRLAAVVCAMLLAVDDGE